MDDFLFVNRDQATISRGTRSRDVSAHVQHTHNTKVAKSRGDWSVEVAAGSSTSPMVPPRRGGEIQPWRIDRPARRSSRPGPMEDVETGDAESTPEPGGSPIQKGNSDPFAALPFPVDPVTNRVLCWFRDDGIPALYPFERAVFGSSSMPSARRKWERTIVSIQSPIIAHAFMASVSALMGRRTRSDVIYGLALRLKGESYSLLRTQLENRHQQAPSDIWATILHMTWAELNTGCVPAAETHLKSLAGYLQDSDTSELNPDFLQEMLAADLTVTALNMVAPVFPWQAGAAEVNYEEWKSELNPSERNLQSSSVPELDEVISEAKLESNLTRLRELVIAAELVLGRRTQAESVFQWLSFRVAACQAELTILLQEYGRQVFEGTLTATGSAETSSWNYCACLTGLAWISETFASRNRGMQQTMAIRLQAAQLRCGLDKVGADGSERFAMWSFYVGSLLEKKIESKTGKRAAIGWHSVRFGLRAKQAGNGEWSQISRVLSQFLHSDILRELGFS
jgi:hypothetical protein